MPKPNIRPRTILGYAESGDGKTSQAYHLAKRVYDKYGKLTRWICADGGGFRPVEDAGLIDLGIVDVFDISDRQNAIADIRRLSEGFWRRKGKRKNKETGEIVPAELFSSDPRCQTTDEEWDKIGLYVVEGIKAIGSLLLRHIATSPEDVGFKSSYDYEEDGYLIKGLQQGHWGIVQGELLSIFENGFKTLPINYLFVTSRVGIGKDKKSKETVYGPDSAGTAITADIPAWFEDCLHLSREVIETGEGESLKKVRKLVAWYVNHIDANTEIKYLAKARCTPETFPQLAKKFPGGYVPIDFENGINTYLDFIEELNKGSKESNVRWKEEVDKRRMELK